MQLVSLPLQQAHLGPLGTQRTPQQLCCCKTTPGLVSVEFHNYKDSVMRVARILWVPIALKDILQKVKGITLIESNQTQMVLVGVRQDVGPVGP